MKKQTPHFCDNL